MHIHSNVKTNFELFVSEYEDSRQTCFCCAKHLLSLFASFSTAKRNSLFVEQTSFARDVEFIVNSEQKERLLLTESHSLHAQLIMNSRCMHTSD